MIDLIISKGLAVTTVLKLFSLTLPFLLAMTIPMATLVAVVLAFGRLSADNEIMAFKANGVNMFRLIQPVLIASTFLTAGMIYFNDVILPETNHKFRKLMIAIHRKHPVLSIEEGVFINSFDGYQIHINKKDDNTSTIYGVVIHEMNSNMRIARTILASSGTLHFDQEKNSFIIILSDGEIHEIDPNDTDKYRRMHFKTHKLNLAIDTSINEQIQTGRGDREMNIQAMRDKITYFEKEQEKVRRKQLELEEKLINVQRDSTSATEDKPIVNSLQKDSLAAISRPVATVYQPSKKVTKPPNRSIRLKNQIEQQNSRLKRLDRSISRYQVEIQKKYALPFACLVFVLIGAPMGVAGRRGIGVVFSFFAFIFYYICLIGGEELADRRLINPYIAMWMANITLGALGVFFLFYTNYERVVIKGEWFIKLIPARLRRSLVSILQFSNERVQ